MGIEEVILEMARQEGRLEANSFFVKNLLNATDFNVEKIAALAGI